MGGAIGLTLGFQHQFGDLVAGVEGDLSWASFSNSMTYNEGGSDGWGHSASWQSYGTLRARAGVTTVNALIYGTAGLAFADVSYEDYVGIAPNGDIASFDGIQVGFAVGAGLEYALDSNWSVKGEYMYIGMPSVTENFYDFDGDPSCPPDPEECTSTWTSGIHSVRVGLNYSF